MKSLIVVSSVLALVVSGARLSARTTTTAKSSGTPEVSNIPLTQWNLQSTADASTVYPVTAPNTVLGALFSSNASGYQFDPFYGKNFEQIDKGQFDVPWTWSTSFNIPADYGSDLGAVLNLDGLIYNATVKINDVVYQDPYLFGAFRRFKLDISSMVVIGSSNTIEITVQKPYEKPKEVRDGTGLSISFYDWAPHPPDLSMGLWRPASVTLLPSSKKFTLDGLTVETEVPVQEPGQSSKNVFITASVVVRNLNSAPATENVWLSLTPPGMNTILLEYENVTVPANSEYRVFFRWQNFPSLVLSTNSLADLLWWPRQMGKANMAEASAGVGSTSSASLTHHFVGLRSMVSRLTDGGALQVYVNNIPLQIRAGAWCPDLFLRTDNQRLEDQMELVVGMGLNAIRLEGKGEHDYFFELANKKGLLLLADLGCCEAFPRWTATELEVASRAMREQVRKLSPHPSVAWILASSDFLGPLDVEKKFYEIYKEEAWPNIVVSSASENYSPLTGTTGVKLTGPYSWVPPTYWLTDDSPAVANKGGAWGFFTEGGPGEAPMTYSSWKQTVPEDELWNNVTKSNSSWWNYHMGNPNGVFKSLDLYFTPPLDARYGSSDSAESYLLRSQAANYESIRSMYEGYSRNKHRNATGLVQWMMNNAWPSNLWHLFDWHLGAGGGFYGGKKAMTDLAVQMSPVDGSVVLINSLFQDFNLQLNVSYSIYTITGEKVSQVSQLVSYVKSDEVVELNQLQVPLQPSNFGPTDTFFVHLTALDAQDSQLLYAENTYWMSPTMDKLNFTASNGFRTPCTQFADFTALQNLAVPTLDLSIVSQNATAHTVTISVENKGTIPAFFLHFEIVNPTTKLPVAPQIWSDNYVTIYGNSAREYTVNVPNFNVDGPFTVDYLYYNGAVTGQKVGTLRLQ